jgi:hypothetical protein
VCIEVGVCILLCPLKWKYVFIVCTEVEVCLIVRTEVEVCLRVHGSGSMSLIVCTQVEVYL